MIGDAARLRQSSDKPRDLTKLGIHVLQALKDHQLAISKLLAIILLAGLAVPGFAFEVRPNPDLTNGSVRIDEHDLSTTCGQSKAHRGSMSHARRDEILTRYGLPPGERPDYEIDHLIPLCLPDG